MELKSINGILFLTFLTDYTIPKIYYYINKYNYLDELITNENFDENSINKIIEKSALSYEKMIYNDIKIIPYYSCEYPVNLNILEDKPPIIFIKGNLDVNKTLINVVGTRNNTEYGELLTKKIVRLLVEYNYGICSGLAYGIDSYAHKYTLLNEGYTIAILPTSLDSIYPKEHYNLANNILKNGGALISELPTDLSLGKRKFIQRNRIQAAFSKFTIPIELNVDSGTMYTVKFSIEQNKDVFFIEPNIKYTEYKSNFDNVINYLLSRKNNIYQKHTKLIKNSFELLKFLEKENVDSKFMQTLFDFT
ncbi:DNA-protecting protein DprA [Aliarcobacter butzleri]|uniref:DNA-protecting protein DprA n=1 Tax=Aliarcobacter butzleri TaxID=28197 RepID=UPI0021B1F836|nr:DNA-protecting protein DprA [Aliarcobacter butzleri]MCT7590565.1 DNA-protecting protein DprA [Aliarcobacter butzleri]